MVVLDRVLSWPGIVLLTGVMFAPVYFPVYKKYEGVVFPVVVAVENEAGQLQPIATEEVAGRCDGCGHDYVDIWVNFDKVRSCEFLGLSWYSETNHRLRVDFGPEAEYAPVSRPVGEQVAGPWRIHGVSTIEGTRAVVSHQCHPLWVTHTEFHP